MREDLYSLFSEWIMNTYPNIFNGNSLVEHMEDGELQLEFLEHMGLPEDTDIWRK